MKQRPSFPALGRVARASWLAITLVGLVPTAALAASDLRPATERTMFAQSIATVAATATNASGGSNQAFITRSILSAGESAATMPFEVALAMRNFDELEARLAHSEIISPAEMQARYLPLTADHDRVVRWLQSEGLTVTRTDANHLAVFAQASVAEVARVFQTTFARVAADGAEFTSAISAPSIPTSLASAVRGIHGLQPHQRLRRRPHSALQPLAGTGNSLPYYPAQIKQAYNATGLAQTGAGQTIAVYALGFPGNTDLTSFWTTTGVPDSLANIQKINVAGGPPSTTSSGSLEEATLDVEWASALAPGAMIRIYAASETDPVGDDELIQQVLADLPTQPTLHQLTISFGSDESTSDRDYIAIEAQYMASLVSAGVTVFAASGDIGAIGNNGAVQTGYPASMPDVTAVGGTTLTLDTGGNVAGEIAWGNLTSPGSGSGGGISIIFNRPAWQTGAGTMRLVPDVAAVGDPNTGGLIVFNGRSTQIGGTSLATPIWAAWCALMNQARASAGKPPLGALNPRLYPLAGTAAFRDITGGGNSMFAAGPGYDLCTGLGVPNVAALLQATMADTFAPVVEVQSGNRFTTTGQAATFYIIATGNPALSYRWQRQPAGTSTWIDLADNATYAGSATFALSVNGATAAMNGDQFQCIVSNGLATVTSPPATLTVTTVGVSTLAGWPGWSGFADGQGSAGRFNYTGSVRVAGDGTVYVADASNNTVRKITLAGVVSTLAGAPGVAGSTDGPGSVARFSGPAGVAIDTAGNVFVADSQNYTIRKITPAGVVSTLAGSAGVRGLADGTGSAASFFDPEDLTIDAAGNLYIADGQGNTVRKVTPAGVVTTLAGAAQSGTTNGPGSAARFNLLAGIAVDAAGNVYVGDYNNNAVRKITPAGTVTTFAGLPGTRNANIGFVDGAGTAARFSGPTGIAVDALGNIYVADSNNNAIRVITPAGVVTTLAGTPAIAENIDGAPAVARFNGPADVAFDANGVLYVADALNCTVRRIVLASSVPAPVITTPPQSQTVGLGGGLVLSVAASGAGPFTYQWSKDGVPITGATTSTYIVTTSATAATAGSYTVAVTGSGGGTITSASAAVSTAAAIPALLTNLSVLTTAGPGVQTLTVGFVLSGTANKTLLIRGIGPGLSLPAFGLTGTIADPVLTLYNSSGGQITSNNDWSTTDATAMAAAGAFPLTPGSTDAAVIATLAPGVGGVPVNYTAQITGTTSGLALAEIYDTAIGAGAKLINLSTMAQVTAGGTLTAGFTISGNVAKTVLIRGLGPALTAVFGVGGTLADPQLALYDSNSNLIQSNTNWGAAPALIHAFTQTGAFQFSTINDAVLLVTLAPGGYTAQVSGMDNTSGLALIEVYEVP